LCIFQVYWELYIWCVGCWAHRYYNGAGRVTIILYGIVLGVAVGSEGVIYDYGTSD
jgi:hypothetical protein